MRGYTCKIKVFPASAGVILRFVVRKYIVIGFPRIRGGDPDFKIQDMILI